MKLYVACLAALLALALGPARALAQSVPPPPTSWVTDPTGFLSPGARATLDARLGAYERASAHQVFVWIGRTTGAEPADTYANRAFQAWRVGRASVDDGVVLFIFADDRRARIEVGYGLEGTLTDAQSSRILREVVLPRLAAGDHDGAVGAGVEQLLTALGAPGKPAQAAHPSARARPIRPLEWLGYGTLALLFVVLAIRHPWLAMALLGAFRGRGLGGGGGAGGGFGGGGGGRSGGGGAGGSW